MRRKLIFCASASDAGVRKYSVDPGMKRNHLDIVNMLQFVPCGYSLEHFFCIRNFWSAAAEAEKLKWMVVRCHTSSGNVLHEVLKNACQS